MKENFSTYTEPGEVCVHFALLSGMIKLNYFYGTNIILSPDPVWGAGIYLSIFILGMKFCALFFGKY